jgi:ADP-ribose pyrophosphatase YjhB (NUDIX family)
MKSYNFCNNCGKGGHTFQQCKIPITSLGIITIKKTVKNDFEFLLICRKDSLGYIDFLRGHYDLDNKKYLINIINIMTESEKNRLLADSFSSLWNKLWGDFIGIQYRGEERTSQIKFEALKKGLVVNNKSYNLESLIKESTTKWTDPEWGFPKGRRNYQEKDHDCAIREWCEETGYNKSELTLVQNILPYEENFTGSNYKSYKHKYYVGVMDSTIADSIDFQTSEVSKISWVSYKSAIQLLRPYNLERLSVLKNINTVLHQYRLYS